MSQLARTFIVVVAVLGLVLATTHPTLAARRWRNHVVTYCCEPDGSRSYEAVIENGERSEVVGEYATYDEAWEAGKDAARNKNRGFVWSPECEELPPGVLC